MPKESWKTQENNLIFEAISKVLSCEYGHLKDSYLDILGSCKALIFMNFIEQGHRDCAFHLISPRL